MTRKEIIEGLKQCSKKPNDRDDRDCDKCPVGMHDECALELKRLALKELERISPKEEQPESAYEYCAECNHIEMCRWYPYEGCEFRDLPKACTESQRESAQESAQASEWIPCTPATMPKEEGFYWVTNINGHVVTYVYSSSGNSEEYWQRCVKAWMPFVRPEPYKEGE